MGRQHWVSQDKSGHGYVTSDPRVSVAHDRGWFLAQGSGWRTHLLPRTLPVSWQRGQKGQILWATTGFCFKQHTAFLLMFHWSESVTQPSLSSVGHGRNLGWRAGVREQCL